MASPTMMGAIAAGHALDGLVAELAAADELITDLVAENEQLRTRLTQAQRPLQTRCSG